MVAGFATYAGRDPSQVESSAGPASVRIDSGWNWMPSTGCVAVAHAHHQAVARPRRDLQLGGERVAGHGQRVVPARLERGGEAGERAAARVLDGRLLAVHRLDADDVCAVGDAHGLVAEADAEHRQGRAKTLHQLHADAGLLRARRTGEMTTASGGEAAIASTVTASLRTTSTEAPRIPSSWYRFQVNES